MRTLTREGRSAYADTVLVRSALHLGAVARQRRLDLDWSQARLAEAAGVSRQWVVAFEAGKPTAELGAVLRAVRALGLAFDLTDAPLDPVDLGEILDG